ncbi:MAG: PAS domain S-box protein [Desulfobacteraceae bacterium]
MSPNGQLIVTLIPKVELIIGKQPPVPELPPQEARNRFQMVLLRFIGVFTEAEHPLALFLDDLQWLDAATLELLTYLTTEEKQLGLLLIGAYRDNEVTPAHPLMQTLETIRKKGGSVQDIVLAPLNRDDVGSLVADALHSSRERALPLAQLLHEKTGGNPFFALQFLTTLAEEKLLAFDGEAKRWTWDLAQIHAKGFTDNVVDLMMDKLGRLPETTRETLKQFACLGSVAKITTLTMVCGQSEDALHGALWEAARTGLIFRGKHTYTFLHDRMQEAAYALIPEADRKALHLKIGRLLLAQYPKEELEDQVFDVVDQFNRSIDIVTDANERERLRRLNTAAGRKARAAVAYASGRRYLEHAMELLPPDPWNACYAESLALHVELAECEYLVGNFQHADALLTAALEKARSTHDLANVYRLRQRLYQLSGRFIDAMTVALQAYRLLGMSLPDTDEDILAATEAEIRLVPGNLRGRSIADLANVPLTNDGDTQALIGQVADAHAPIYVVRPVLWPLITAKAVNLCLQRGHADEAPFLYSCYAMVLVAIRHDIPSALQFSEMSLSLSERLPGASIWRGRLLAHHWALISIWGSHFAKVLPHLDRAFHVCLDLGDIVYAGYLTYNTIWLHVENGDPLEEVIEIARRHDEFARQTNNRLVYDLVRVEEQFALCLQGKTQSNVEFSDASFHEAETVAAIEQAGFGTGIAFHYIMKLIAAYLAGRNEEALSWAEHAAPMLPKVASHAIGATCHFYHALTLAALHAQAPAEQQRRFTQTIGEILPKLKRWADHCPENFANRYLLVSAEIARIEGRDMEAMRLYDQAIGSARDNHFIHQEALAAEIASRFYRMRGFDRIADAYRIDAHGAYARWGASGKVRQMEQRYPQLREAQAPSTAPGATVLADAKDLDILAVVQAARTISGEIHLDSLLKALMRIVLENAGARQGYLLLNRKEELSLAAAARVEGDDIAMQVRGEAGFSETVFPTSVLNYVSRSGEWVLLDDATGPNPYSSDEYFTRRHPKSVLCFPITKQTKLIGLLYMENDLATHTFTPEHLALLELLAAQAAISLENALIYGALQESEKGLRQLTRFHRTILNSAAYSIISAVPDGIITSFNPAAERLLGYTADEVIGKQTPALWHDPREVEHHARRLSEELGEKIEPGFNVFSARPKRNLPEENEWTFIRKDGTRLPVNLSVTALRDADQRVTGYVGMIYDLTERKQVEAEIHRLNAELEQRVADRTADLQSANKELEAFAYSVSHDLRAPLRHIDGFIQLLQKKAWAALDDKSRHYMDSISEAANSMGLLIDDLLSFSRMGRHALSLQAMELAPLVRDVIRELAPDAESRAIDWRIGDLPAVTGDAALLRMALVNLIANALKFTLPRETARIEIGSQPEEEGEVVIFVRDNGVGFDMAYADKLFGVFQRLHRQEAFEGTGIGLANVHRIIARHGGRIWAHSQLDQGATFYFSLPQKGRRV